VDEEYFVTALVPSETACLASSPGRINRTLEELGQFVTQIKCDERVEHTRFGSPVTKWSTSCCKQQASMPQLQRVRKYLYEKDQFGPCNQIRIQATLTVHERVEDRHSAVGNSSIRMHLLENCTKSQYSRVMKFIKARPHARHVSCVIMEVPE
jgi:hypothetical protein